MPTSFDAIVIGTGQSGPSLAVKLAGAGQKVAIIERGRFGGTCVNTGCIPTKAMVASARAAYMARRAADFGVEIDAGIRVDMARVKARKDKISGASRTGVEHMLDTTNNCTVYRGHGRFRSDHEIEVGGETLTANKIFINVGARAVIPKLQGLSNIPYFTNSSLLEIDFLPASLIIVGGSYVGLELGQMFRRFGSEVTILERGGQLLSREDADISNRIRDILENEGIQVKVNAECIGLAETGGEIEAHTSGSSVNAGNALRGGSGTRRGGGATLAIAAVDEPSTAWLPRSKVRGTHVLIASGREPNTDDLGLENTGVKRDKRGYIEVDDQLRASVEGVWAIGDCNGRGAFTHTSYNDFEIVAANLLDNDSRRVTDRITAYAVYTDPPLGRVGMSEREVRKSGRKALIGRREMTKVGRAVEKGETQGFMKILVDANSEEIMGAAILGTGGDEAIHGILDVMYAKAPYTVLQRAVHIHPTVSELIPTMLGDLKPL